MKNVEGETIPEQEYHGPLPTVGWPFGPVQPLPEQEYHGPWPIPIGWPFS
jgi:hypothetical protein